MYVIKEFIFIYTLLECTMSLQTVHALHGLITLMLN